MMADECSHLIHKVQDSHTKTTTSLSCYDRINQYAGVHSKGVILVLLWASINTIAITLMLVYPYRFAVSSWNNTLFYSAVAFFPIFGYLGEKWTRYSHNYWNNHSCCKLCYKRDTNHNPSHIRCTSRDK